MSEHRKSIPAVALRGMTILPGMIAHFDVSRERSIQQGKIRLCHRTGNA